jgi:hypothetical protein
MRSAVEGALPLLASVLFALAPSLPATLATFGSSTSSPGNAFTNLVVAPATLNSASSIGGGIVRLSWSASPTASTETVTYGILRRPSGGAFAQVATVSGLTYDDAPGDGFHDYEVRAIVSGFSADGNALSAMVDTTAPTAASGVTAATGTANGTVDLAWSAAADATSGVAGYTIRYVQANTCPAASPAAYPGTTSVGTVASATVTGLVRNKQYCFYLVTIDNAGNQSGPSNVASAKAK